MPMWPLIPIVILLGTMLSSCGSENGKGESDEETDEKKEKDEKKETEETEEFEKEIAECESTKGEPCTCNALVCCTSSANETETVHIKKREEDRNILMADIAQLNRTDIEREKEFTVCKFSPDKKCTLDVTYIEDQEWKAYDESSSQGDGKELLNANESYMICTYGRGYLFFKDAGQVMRSEMEEMADLKRIPEKYHKYYINNKDLINQITVGNRGDNFAYDIWNLKKIFDENKDVYEEIANETGVPPELIAAIHYRESGCNFETYLHNGQPLGEPTTIVPKGRIFYDFSEAAIDALNSEQKNKDISLSKDDSIEMMMLFAELYNGTGYTDYKNTVSPYVYSGTDVYISGKYASDGVYDPNLVDKQPGIYLLIVSLDEEASDEKE